MELLAIRTVLKKDPEEYPYNTYQRIVGTQVGAKEGDTIITNRQLKVKVILTLLF
jgi:hypothetical protein